MADGKGLSAVSLIMAAKGGSGGGEPAAYLKSATTSGNTLTLTKKDDTTVTYTPDLSAYRTAANQDIIDNGKQDTISDLNTIRSGAALGATALQSVPSEYVTQTELEAYHDSTKQNTLTAGSNITISGSTISATDTTYSEATTSAAGLESAADKTKLDSLVNVSGTDDGTNWQTITIDGTTKNIPAGGGSSYTFTNGLTENSGTVSWNLNDIIKKSTYNDSNMCVGIGEIIPYQLQGTNNLAVGTNVRTEGNNSITFGKGKTFNSIVGGGPGSLTFGYDESLSGSNKVINNKRQAQLVFGTGDAPYSIGTGNNGIGSGLCYGYVSGGYSATENNPIIKNNGTGSYASGCSKSTSKGITCIGEGSHAEGYIDQGDNSSYQLRASSTAAFSMGYGTVADSACQHAIGKFNVADPNSTYLFIIGNGTAYNARSNALTVDWAGNIVCNNIPAQPAADGNYVLKCSIVSGVATYSWVAE